MSSEVTRKTVDRGVQTEETLLHTEREILDLQERANKLERLLQSYEDMYGGDDMAGGNTSNDADNAATRNATDCCVDTPEDIINLRQRLQRLECDVITLRYIQKRDGQKKVEQNRAMNRNSTNGGTFIKASVNRKKPARKLQGKANLRNNLARNLESIEEDSNLGCPRALFLLEQFDNYNRSRSSWSESMWRLFTSWQSRHYEAYTHMRETLMMLMPLSAKFSVEVLKDKETCIEWLMEQALLPRAMNCPECMKEMKLSLRGHGMGRFRCRRTHASGRPIEQQLSKNTFFERSKISPETVVFLIYAFTNKMTFEQAIRETSRQGKQTSPDTVTQWYSYCRDICMDAVDRKFDEGKIGGVGHMVEIDEFKICRTIYNKGRMIDRHWILAMIEHEGDFRLEIGPNNKRDRATMEDLIKKHILPGTTIITDCWKGYNELEQQGFTHFIDSNSYHLVDLEKGANALMIESNWMSLRKRLAKGGVKNEQMTMHICEFLWRKEMLNNKMDPFISFLHEIRINYPVQ